MKNLAILYLLFFLIPAISLSQPTEQLQQWTAQIIENISEEQNQEIDFSYLIDDLIELYQNPININNAERKDLEKIFFLSDSQIESLL